MLRAELEELAAAEFDLSLTGFSDPEVDTLLHSLECLELTDEDAAPALEDNVTSAPGDLWQMGAHRRRCPELCGDRLGEAESGRHDRKLRASRIARRRLEAERSWCW